MISARLVIEDQPLIEVEQFVRGFNKVVGNVTDDAFHAIEKPMLDEFAYYPNRRSGGRYIWSHNAAANARARAWWFAAIRRGDVSTDGNRYVRTGAYAKSWKAFVRHQGNVHSIVIQNNYKGAKYVGGSFDRRRDYRNPSHISDGWPRSLETADYWLNVAQEESDKQLDRFIDDTLGRVGSRRVNR